MDMDSKINNGFLDSPHSSLFNGVYDIKTIIFLKRNGQNSMSSYGFSPHVM